jgi:hypothetical protein
MTKIEHSFRASEKLRRHIDCLLSRGGMYKVSNSNLMFHGSVPLDADGQLKEVEIEGKLYKGQELMQKIDRIVRNAFNTELSAEKRRFSTDYMWYLWCGPDSPLFDKDKMATFERYFIADPKTHKEKKGYYYQYNNDEATIDMILDSFDVEGTHRHIINGHVPVKTTKGETPIKANGKLLVIDGGFSKAYQPETGIAGYTLIFHSRGLELMQHQPFRSAEEAIKKGDDIKSAVQIVEIARKTLPERTFLLMMNEVAEAKKAVRRRRAWRIEGTLREFPRPDPIDLWFDYPIHLTDEIGVLKDCDLDGERNSKNSPYSKNFGRQRSKEEKKESRMEALETAFSAVEENGKAEIKDLAEYLDVTEMTVRRYLKEHGEYEVGNGVVTQNN